MHCYFCLTNVRGFNGKTRDKIQYPSVASAITPVQRSGELPVPIPPANKDVLVSAVEICFVPSRR